jgi:3-hydroxyacyl-[acyl-carrier protein] dehydratase/trans-2-decenoyl-[acyl-carrier protein] isomerase
MTKQNAFTREDLLRCSRGELFGPGNAQLPSQNIHDRPHHPYQ